MKRILMTDNYGMSGEAPGKDERFLLWPMSEMAARKIVEALNDDMASDGPHFFRVESMDYKLKVFEP